MCHLFLRPYFSSTYSLLQNKTLTPSTISMRSINSLISSIWLCCTEIPHIRGSKCSTIICTKIIKKLIPVNILAVCFLIWCMIHHCRIHRAITPIIWKSCTLISNCITSWISCAVRNNCSIISATTTRILYRIVARQYTWCVCECVWVWWWFIPTIYL